LIVTYSDQRGPIVTHEGKIWDGRNRWRACKKAGVELKTKEYRRKDPLAFVIGMNLQRHLVHLVRRCSMMRKSRTIRVEENDMPVIAGFDN
jgi:hypothetical protein